MTMRAIAIGSILIAGCLSASAAKLRAKAPAADPLRAKCVPLVQASICLPKGNGDFNCPETFEAEVDGCVKKRGQYP